MKTVFFFPQYPKGGASNSYCDDYIDSIKDHFRIFLWSRRSLPRCIEFLLGSVRADVFFLNWLESINRLKGGSIQAIVAILALYIVRIRRKKIVWMFHNIHPHEGENVWSRIIQRILFKWSSIIVSHSEEAASYARKRASCPVYYKPHPFRKREYGVWDGPVIDCDFFIWGDIYPYKGIVELLADESFKRSGALTYIVGETKVEGIKERIMKTLPDNVVFEDRRAGFDEIAAQCKHAKYVLFPYVGESISSSGVLMDTLVMGGLPVGPNQGAFADLQKMGFCVTYNKLDELSGLINSPLRTISNEVLDKFIGENNWGAFGRWICKRIDSLYK